MDSTYREIGISSCLNLNTARNDSIFKKSIGDAFKNLSIKIMLVVFKKAILAHTLKP